MCKKWFTYICMFLGFGMACAWSADVKDKADYIVIEKASRKMYLYQNDKIIKSYDIHLGNNPVGPKQQEGDGKTPEGDYYISGRNPNSKFHLSLRISYPNAEDIAQAQKRKVSTGGDIMIHGTPNKLPSWLARWTLRKDWTAGCIAVTNDEIEEIWQLVDNGTKITIKP